MSRKHDAGVSPQEPPSSSAASGCEPIKIDRRTSHSTLCRWTIRNFPTLSKTKVLYSPYFEVGGFDCRFVLYPKGDSISLTGALSLYIQLIHPSTYKFNCFAHYKLSILNHFDKSESICRDSVYRSTRKKKSFGWIEFAISSTVLDPKVGFVFDESLVILGDICVLDESSSFVPDIKYGSSGKFTWNINNIGIIKEILRTHKLTSPNFTVEQCNLRVVAYQTKINGVEYLSIGVDGKDNEKLESSEDRSCWCMFKVSVLNRKSICHSIHRDKYGRVGMDSNFGDKLIGWSDYMEMSRFIGLDNGFVDDDTVVICVSFQAMQESSNSMTLSGCLSGKNCVRENKSDRYSGKFMWTIKNFTRLKDVLKKRKITGVDAKSPRFQIGNQDLRLVVYPRGQSHPPSHLSLFLEVTDSNNDSPDWSCFLSYRLSVVNKKLDKVFEKHSQTRCSKDRKELGWSEFMTLNQLFDKESGFLSEDEVTLSADVSVLKEIFVEAKSCTMGFLGLEMDLDMKKDIFIWKMENFLSFKEISDTKKVVSRIFLVGGCELQMGASVISNRLCASLECNPLVVSGPDKRFFVSYRIRVVNHKNPAKSLWRNSSFCTKTSNNSVLKFMTVPEMAESTSRCGHEAFIFICEILDCCPCPECTEQEVLASQGPNEVAHSNASQPSSGDVVAVDIIGNFLAKAKLYLIMCRDNCFPPQVTENILNTSDWICGILNKACNYLDESIEVEDLHRAMKRFGCNSWKQDSEKTNEFLPTPLNVLAKVRLLQLETIHFLLNIMVQCCHHLEGKSTENFSEASSEPSADNSGVISQLIFHEENGLTDYGQSLKNDVYGAKDNSVYQCSDAMINDASREAFHGETGEAYHGETPFKTPAKVLAKLGSIQVPKRFEQSEELLMSIINSLKSLDDIEPKHRHPSVQKISEILDKSPKHIKKDLVSLLPKLVDRSEHPLAASALLDQLRKPDTDPVLQLAVFSATSQLDFCGDLWDQVFAHSSKLLVESHNEQLADTIGFLFKAASRCQHIPQAVRILRVRLRRLGADVLPCVLDSLSKALNIWLDLAKVMLREIDCVSEPVDKYLEGLGGPLLFDENEHVTENFNMVNDQLLHEELHFWDIYILIELISIPSLTIEASEVFGRAVTRGSILESSVGRVLERRRAQRLYVASITFADNKEHGCVSGDENIGSSPSEEVEFNSVLGLTERLSLSVDSRVHQFVTRLYVFLFKFFASESYYKSIIRELVHRAMRHSNDLQEVVLDFDILVCLLKEELGLSELILDMMREVAKVATADHESILDKLRVSEANHLNRLKETETELLNLAKEKDSLLKRLTESWTATKHLKAELSLQMDRFASKKKDLSKRTQEVESQLKRLQSERNDEITKLATKTEGYKDRLHNAKVQLSQLRSQNSDDLERVLKEKEALAKKLKSTEAMMIRLDEKLKRCDREIMIQKDIRQSLEDEVCQLKERVGQIEVEKREKEEQIMWSKAYIARVEAELTAHQQHIHALEVSLREEMSQHAPLYGVGLADLSIKELETLSRIHEEGLREIDAIKQQKLGLGVISPVSGDTVSKSHIPYPTASPPVAISLNKRNLNYKTGDAHGSIAAPRYDQT